MVDSLSKEERSKLMSRIGATNTLPEVRVRSLIHRLGFRFSLHRKDLPGTPDVVLPAREAVIFVHGCFWHGHNCKKGRMPKSRTDYWKPKIEGNKRRDERKRRQLRDLGWNVIYVRECELQDMGKLTRKLLKRLDT